MSENERETHGFKVRGELHPGSFSEQAEPELLINALKELLAVDGVDHVKWTQYTPYYSDGEVRNFSVNDLQVFAKGEYEDDEITVMKYLPKGEEWDWRSGRYVKMEEGMRERTYNVAYDFYPSLSVEHPHPEFEPEHDAMRLGIIARRMLSSGEHEVFLCNTFGDHTEVKFDGTAFTHDYYSHD